MGCVYLSQNKTNGKQYTGKTMYGLHHRIREHTSDAKCENAFAFARAIAKYGPEEFRWVVLFKSNCDEQLLRVEREMIAMLHTLSPRGYNLTTGGEGARCSAETIAKMKGRKVSLETRKKMSAAQKGKKMSPECCKKMASSRCGKKASLETLAKMSAARKGRKRAPFSAEWLANMSAAQKGKKMSPEAIAKTAAANRGKKRSPETRAKMRVAALKREARRRGEEVAP